METKCNFLKSLAAQAEGYFSLMDKPSLTAEEQLRAEMYRETLARKILRAVQTLNTSEVLSLKRSRKLHP